MSLYTHGTCTSTIPSPFLPYRYAEWSDRFINRAISNVGIRNRKICGWRPVFRKISKGEDNSIEVQKTFWYFYYLKSIHFEDFIPLFELCKQIFPTKHVSLMCLVGNLFPLGPILSAFFKFPLEFYLFNLFFNPFSRYLYLIRFIFTPTKLHIQSYA